MKRLYKLCLLLLTIAGYLQPAIGQSNIHFSQFYNAPMMLNPALTGKMDDDVFRLNGHSRQQWSGVESSTDGFLYETYFGGGDISILNKRVGIGFSALMDKAGGGIFNTFNFMPSASYSFIMGDNMLTFGGQYVYNLTQFSHPSPNPPIGVPFDNKSSYSDMNAGVNMKFDLFYITTNAGVSVEHLLQPSQKFLGTTTVNKIPMFYKAHVNFDYEVNDRLKVQPGFFGGFQSMATDFVFGSNLSYKLINGGVYGNRMLGGLWFRTNNGNLESIIPKFGMRMNKLMIMASYDYNLSISKGGNSNYIPNLTNTFEISIIFTAKPPVVPTLFEDDFILNPRY